MRSAITTTNARPAACHGLPRTSGTCRRSFRSRPFGAGGTIGGGVSYAHHINTGPHPVMGYHELLVHVAGHLEADLSELGVFPDLTVRLTLYHHINTGP